MANFTCFIEKRYWQMLWSEYKPTIGNGYKFSVGKRQLALHFPAKNPKTSPSDRFHFLLPHYSIVWLFLTGLLGVDLITNEVAHYGLCGNRVLFQDVCLYFSSRVMLSEQLGMMNVRITKIILAAPTWVSFKFRNIILQRDTLFSVFGGYMFLYVKLWVIMF